MKTLPTLALLSCLLLSAISHARVEPGFYVGVDMNTSLTGNAKETYETSTYEAESDIDTSSLNLLVGYRFASNKRFQISRSNIDVIYEGSGSNELTGTDFDWHFVYTNDKIQPYWGLGFGYYTFNDSARFIQRSNDLTGVSFQLLGGVKFDFSNYIEMDVSYRIKSIAWESVEVTDGYYYDTMHLSHNSSALNFGIAAKF